MKKDIVKGDVLQIANAIKNIAPKLEGKTLVITGGAGFIGSYIIAVIQYFNTHTFTRKCSVISLDNYITGSPKGLLPLPPDPYIRYRKHNVVRPYNTRMPIDYIINAAGIASPIYYRQSPLETVDVTITGLRNMLELARTKKVKSFLYFSSSEIYGDPPPRHIPTPESYRGNVSSIGPRSPYDESKRLGETICMIYHQLYKLPVKIVRPFNVYGPGMKPTDYRVIPMFVSRGTKGKTLPVHDKGKQTRTFCYITDAIIGIFKIFLSDENGEVYNVGNDDVEITMYELAKRTAHILGNSTKIEKISYPSLYPQDEPQRRCPDLKKIRKCLRYSPKVSLNDGLRRFIDWYKAQYGV